MCTVMPQKQTCACQTPSITIKSRENPQGIILFITQDLMRIWQLFSVPVRNSCNKTTQHNPHRQIITHTVNKHRNLSVTGCVSFLVLTAVDMRSEWITVVTIKVSSTTHVRTSRNRNTDLSALQWTLISHNIKH